LSGQLGASDQKKNQFECKAKPITEPSKPKQIQNYFRRKSIVGAVIRTLACRQSGLESYAGFSARFQDLRESEKTCVKQN